MIFCNADKDLVFVGVVFDSEGIIPYPCHGLWMSCFSELQNTLVVKHDQ